MISSRLHTFLVMVDALPKNVVGGWVFLVGLAVGSFLNVCIYRWPAGEHSAIQPRSFCPACKQPIAWHDNIPILGYLLLKGRCRRCAKPISIRYPVVEFFTALTLYGLYWDRGISAALIFYGCFICMLIIASVTDMRERIIPDEVSFYGIVFALLMSYFFPSLQHETNRRLALADATLGMLLGGGVLYGVAVIGDFAFKRESMGGGDIKLLAMIGAFLGTSSIFPTLFLASAFGAVVGMALKWVRKAEVIAFGPFLALGAVVSFYWGPMLMNWLFPVFYPAVVR